jgi:hypothetical protein
MNVKCILLKMFLFFIVTCLLYSCNRADNIKVITQEGVITSRDMVNHCTYNFYKDGIYRKYTVIDSLSNKVLAEFVEADTFYNNLENVTSGCYAHVEYERLYKNLSNSISDPYLEWYLNRCLYCFRGSSNKDLTNFLLTHQASYKDQLVDRLRYDEYYDTVNDSILAVLENSIYSPREYAKLYKVDTFVSMYCKKYKPTSLSYRYRKDSIFPINILDIKTSNRIYFYKPYFFIYQQSYEAFQQVKANRHKEGYFYKISEVNGFDNSHLYDYTLLFHNAIFKEQTILKNNLGQWGYNQRVLNPMIYTQRTDITSGYPIYTADLEALLSLPMTEEAIIRAHEESEKIRRQRKDE